MRLKSVTSCTSRAHKVKCLEEVLRAVRRTQFGNERRNGNLVSIRDAISDPCTCHIDALLWVLKDTNTSLMFSETMKERVEYIGRQRVFAGLMH